MRNEEHSTAEQYSHTTNIFSPRTQHTLHLYLSFVLHIATCMQKEKVSYKTIHFFMLLKHVKLCMTFSFI